MIKSISIKIFIAIVLLGFSSCLTTRPLTEDQTKQKSIIVGTWKNDHVKGGLIEIVADEKNRFSTIMRSNDSTTSAPGDVVGKFRFNKSGKTDFWGKHIWGGSRSDVSYWGEFGKMTIEIVGSNTIKIVFLDSKYTDGWIYTKQ